MMIFGRVLIRQRCRVVLISFALIWGGFRQDLLERQGIREIAYVFESEPSSEVEEEAEQRAVTIKNGNVR